MVTGAVKSPCASVVTVPSTSGVEYIVMTTVDSGANPVPRKVIRWPGATVPIAPRSVVSLRAIDGGMAGGTGAVGFTALDGALAGESPVPVWATTVTVYVTPATAPRTQLVAAAEPVAQLDPPGLAVAV